MDRISIAVWAIAVTLAASTLIGLPGRGAVLTIGTLTVALPISGRSVIPLLLAILAGSGAEAVVRAHPLASTGRLRFTMRLWALPVAVTLIAALAVPQAPSTFYRAAGLLLFPLLLGGVLVALYFSLDTQATGYRRARAALNLAAYGVALLLFLLVPPDWESWLQGLVLGIIALMLALEVLRGTQVRGLYIALHALIVGAVVAEVAWALSWTGLSRLSSGLLLLLLFYVLVGLTWHSLLARLTRRVVLEFTLVALVAFILIVTLVP